MNLLQSLRRRSAVSTSESRSVYPWDGFTFDGVGYGLGRHPVQLTMKGEKALQPDTNLQSYARDVYQSNGPLFALVAVRQLTFSCVEFKWQNLGTRDLFGNRSLQILEEPWQGGTTQNLLARTLVDADLCGNSYWVRDGRELVRLDPDRVDILLAERDNGTLRKALYRFYPDGRHGNRTVDYTPDEVVHFMPLADPVAPWRGMSWVTPVLRELSVDQSATTHQRKFFENAATPNLAVTLKDTVTPEQFQEFIAKMDDGHKGAQNAYKTLYLGGGADVTVVGTDLSALNLKDIQGGLETRLAAAAGVPVSVAGFREGNQGSALNASTYAQARRRFADGTLDPLWREAAGSFAKIVPAEGGARLWFDTRHVPFLREDLKDRAEVMSSQLSAIRQGVEAGFIPDAVVNAVMNDDLKQLLDQHTGLTSVQMQPPQDPNASEDETPAPDGGGS